ncbi:ATP-binding protein [Glycomyces sp. NRRL B-16210]|uniref:AAA family ATPase n=1 Tax=Glycomyces sp. NRRL B-16210 TaxID=1463821 RepID=UPI0004C15D63|nr:ATP-binding protein [Glycomyces sp. NRRL B-16210]
MEKPQEMFDRESEWAALERFVADDRPGATLGVVSGRRRQGKTFLLDAVVRATGGFYFGATEAADAESLRRFSDSLTRFATPPTAFHFADWFEAIDAVLALGRERSIPVVIDEFPYLARANPELPSILQQAFGPLRPERTASRTRLLLCGSAMSFMGRLLSGGAPLRGRAGLELLVPPLDYRKAAEFWGIGDPGLAMRTHAVVGGTPAYPNEFLRGDTPRDREDFDDWVIRTVLNPQTPLFREGRYLLAEEADVRDPALYLSVLSAVADGNATRNGIAAYLGRKAVDIAHPIDVLEDIGLLRRDADAFRKNRSAYRIAEPLIAFYAGVMRPMWDQLQRPGMAARVWKTSRRRFDSKILGPHFEQLCRDWALYHADPDRFGDLPTSVASGVVNDPAAKTSHEVDVAVIAASGEGRPRLLAIGEAKWQEVMGRAHLERLERIRHLLQAAGTFDTSATRLMCLSGAGHNDHLAALAAEREDLLLIGLPELYG